MDVIAYVFNFFRMCAVTDIEAGLYLGTSWEAFQGPGFWRIRYPPVEVAEKVGRISKKWMR